MSYTLVVGQDGPDRAWIEDNLLQGSLQVAAATEADVLATKDLMTPRIVVVDDAGRRDDRLATLRRLQAHPALKGIPILVLAYDGDIDSFTEAITRGVSAYLVKPISANELMEVVGRLAGWMDASDRTERRRRLRRPLILKIEVHVRARHVTFMGSMIDVSGGGCRIELPEPVQAGELLRIVLHSQDASTHVALGAEVRWSTPGPENRHEAGCRFTGTTALLAGKMLGIVSTGLT